MLTESSTSTPVYIYRDHAKFLRDSLPVSLCQAKEMISYYYKCSSWEELMDCAPTSREFDNYEDAQECKRQLQSAINSKWNSQMGLVNNLPLLPNTISEIVSKMEFGRLLDDEVFQLHHAIFEGCEEPIYSMYEALERADNNILTKIYMMKEKGEEKKNNHLLDYRFGLEIYYNLFLEGDNIKMILREVDSLYYRSNKLDRACSRSWFVNYIAGYISILFNRLKLFCNSPEIILQRVNGIDVVNLDNLATYYKEMGAVETTLYGNRDVLKLNLS